MSLFRCPNCRRPWYTVGPSQWRGHVLTYCGNCRADGRVRPLIMAYPDWFLFAVIAWAWLSLALVSPAAAGFVAAEGWRLLR